MSEGWKASANKLWEILSRYNNQTCSRPTALRKQVSTYAKENEELRSQADALKEEIATLSERQENSGEVEGRTRKTLPAGEDDAMNSSPEPSRAEGSGNNTNHDTPFASKSAMVTLRKENERLEEQVRELREEIDSLNEEALRLKKERKASKKQWEADFERLEGNLKQRWEKERQKLIAEKDETAARCEWCISV